MDLVRDQHISGHPARREYPARLFVEVTSRCNLNCFMCVKQTAESGICEGDLSADLFRALAPAWPHLEALLLNGVGEPLLHPRLEEFIRLARRAVPADCWIGFQSNGLLLDERRALSLARAGLDRVCLSLDSLSPENFRRVREGGELSAVERALAALAVARRTERPQLQVGVEFVLMRDNLHELPAVIAWAAAKGAAFALVSHMLPYDAAHAGQAAYELCTDAAIELFGRWQEKARQAGVDLRRYFDVLWKFDKGAEDRQIVRFVNAMKAEAESRQMTLDLKKLLALDLDFQQRLREVFAETKQVAAAAGLELRLPEIVPTEARRCHFVEDGGAFVAWNGDVHPCYFLWHRYNCFASGWEQKVQTRTFGNLAAAGLREIWNGADFRAFRESVLDYSYPHCASCTLAPCDYVQTEAFEQDCHIKGEPCGSCLWCTGLFQCLR